LMPDRKSSKIPSRKNSSARLWIFLRKVVQLTAFIIFIALFISASRKYLDPGVINLPMRLDPLLALSNLISSRYLLAGSALALSIVVLTIVFGRAWCGWICPLGTLLDWFKFGSRGSHPGLGPGNDTGWRKVKYGLIIAILVAALFSNLTLLIFDPLTILFRTLSASLWPALDQAVTAVEMSLINVPVLVEPVAAIDALIRPSLFPVEPAYTPASLLYAVIFGGILCLNLFAPRFWCRYICPLGGLLGLISKFALFRRQVRPDCKGCALCERVCPTGTIDPERNFASDPSECTLCLDCLEACPRSTITFTPHLAVAEWREYDPNRRQALTTIGLTIGGLAILAADTHQKIPNSHLIRPPGTTETGLLSNCLRCSECVKACPTHGLQPAISESGLVGLWTPILIPRLGYCDYSCNTCGQICPAQAIPLLSLEDKRTQVIGKAYIDQNRCIAWSDHLDCIVCQEMCPLPEKAITLQVGQWKQADGEMIEIQLPQVNRQTCIGCGICEYKCPVSGDAAIRVYLPS
jgi:polyferredoxin